MSDKQLQVIESVKGTQLEQYADRAVLRELTNRLLKFHPAANEVGEPGMLMAAQLAVLMGASPIPGTNEIHIYKDKHGVQVTPGINYWQRRGDQKGGVLWDIEPRPMSEAERELYQIDGGFYAAICRGVKMADVRELRELGLPIDAIIKMKGVTGIGVAGRNEYAKNGRPPVWTAIKRAKTDFYKMSFPFIPGEQINPGTGLRRDADGAIRPDYSDAHWGNELSWEAQEERDPSEFAQRLSEMPKAQFDAEIFGDGNAPTEAEYSDVADDTDPEPVDSTDDPARMDVETIRNDLARYTKLTGVQVADCAISTGKYNSREHVENALKHHDGFAKSGGKLSAGVSSAVGLDWFDWLMERKSE